MNQRAYEAVREIVYKHISEMLDNPNQYEIYPTTRCYHNLAKAIAEAVPEKIVEKEPCEYCGIATSDCWNTCIETFLKNWEK